MEESRKQDNSEDGFPTKIREIMARALHDEYRAFMAERGEPDVEPWNDLLVTLRNSNRKMVDSIPGKLRRINCSIQPVSEHEPKLMKFTHDEIELLSEMEHTRWVAERFLDGWKYGKVKDVQRKISPYLVGWSELDDDIRELDRLKVLSIPKTLAAVGLEIVRNA